MAHTGRFGIGLFFAFVVVLGAFSFGAAPNEEKPAGQDLDRQLIHDELERTYRLHVPPGHDKGRRVPLVLVLHGGGGTSVGMVRLTRGGFDRLADKGGFLVAYPDGVEKHWNDGRTETKWRAHEDKIDDVGFLSAIIDDLVKNMGADPQRVYSTGISNGAMMSFRLGCEVPDKIAAIGPVAASMPVALCKTCKPRRPVPVVFIMGTDDPLAPYKGGEVRLGRQRFGKVISAKETVAFWVKHNGCAGEPEVMELPDRDRRDGARVRREKHAKGKEDSEVVFYSVEGGGHTWPGGEQYLGKWLVGTTCRDMDACEVIWEFFKRHTRKGEEQAQE